MTQYIDPERLKQEIERRKLMLGMSTGRQVQWDEAMKRATVEVDAVPRGYWLAEQDSHGDTYYRCAHCGGLVTDDEAENYCILCGARMDSDKGGCGEG